MKKWYTIFMAGFLFLMVVILIWPNPSATPITEHIQLPPQTIEPFVKAPTPLNIAPVIKPPVVTTTTPQKTSELAAGAPIVVPEPQSTVPTPIAPPTVIYVPIYVPVEPTPTPAPTPQPVPEPIISNPSPQPMPESQARIEIFSPQYLLGTKVTHSTKTEINPETQEYENKLLLGAILYDAEGKNEHLVPMEIAATDSSQNKTINDTGTFDSPRNVYYYFYNYEFKTPGDHTITFSSSGVTKSITINIPS